MGLSHKWFEGTENQGKFTQKYCICNQCGHEWKTRPWRYKDGKSMPFKCPNCGSRYW